MHNILRLKAIEKKIELLPDSDRYRYEDYRELDRIRNQAEILIKLQGDTINNLVDKIEAELNEFIKNEGVKK